MSASGKSTRAEAAQTVAQIEQRLQQRWFDLTQAEDAGKGADTLTDLFERYMADLAALVAARAPAVKQSARPTSRPRAMLSA